MLPTGALPPRARGTRRPARRRPRRHAADAPVWLFDLDNTLHHASHAIFPFINRAMTAYICERLDVARPIADRLRVEYTRRYGATLLGLVRRHAIDGHDFLHAVHPNEGLAALLRSEYGLRRALARLPGRRIILTNGAAQYARDVLIGLGIADLFEDIVAVEQMRRGARWFAKPDALPMRALLRRLGASPARTVLVEDTHTHLKRYRRLHLRTVWMTGHLPPRTGGAPHRTQGRPHYVDLRIASLHQLRAGRGGRPERA
ncbi:pyrimidine 5'-nucleotidase [Chitinasiproducens palmae]|uniref:pyrimidine 5'-nucleotidase n=1 Tax=Chitinasiproducens palmae TaxID=1770053 RepID=UPI000B8728E8